ncbi:hypothetical protein KAI32_00485 [Candidatus Pacearchaeota archaeon]|nr:hypothetical protein [Candidatus Pacearchaeota archaeon]
MYIENKSTRICKQLPTLKITKELKEGVKTLKYTTLGAIIVSGGIVLSTMIYGYNEIDRSFDISFDKTLNKMDNILNKMDKSFDKTFNKIDERYNNIHYKIKYLPKDLTHKL